jgi:hypothetical protein
MKVLSVLVSFLAFSIASCGPEQTLGPTPIVDSGRAATPASTAAAIPTSRAEVTAAFCTKLGCSSGLGVGLVGDPPSTYILQADDSDGNRFVLHCFGEDEAKRFPYTFEEYSLDNPQLEDVVAGSEAPYLCRPEDSGRLRVWTRNDGSLERIVVSCSEIPYTSAQAPSTDAFLANAECDGSLVLLWTLTPEELTVTVYWESKSKTITAQPVYHSYWPNGPDCEPECRNGGITITIP